MTRILHILSQRPGRSGSGVFLKALVREAGLRGYDQHVIAGGPLGTSAAELPPLTDDRFSPIIFPNEDAPFDVPGNSDVMPYPSTRFSDLTDTMVDQYLAAGRRVMERVKQEFDPEIVHAHHLFLMSALAREVFDDRPVVATPHNAALRLCVKNPHLMPRLLPGIRGIDRIGVLTPQSKQDTIDMYGVDEDRIVLTQAGFRGDQFFVPTQQRIEIRERLVKEYGVQLPAGLGEPGGEQLVTFVGRLSTAKGIPFLIEAVKKLKREDVPPFRLVLVGATGSGEDGSRMDDIVRAGGDVVIHAGVFPEAAVALFLQCSDIFVLPSLFEGLPLTMLEAAACGCRCVVSGLPTITSWVPRTWLDNGTMHLIPKLQATNADVPVEADVSRFINAIADGIRTQLERPWSEKDRRTLGDEMRRHTWASVFDRYEVVYRELLGKSFRRR